MVLKMKLSPYAKVQNMIRQGKDITKERNYFDYLSQKTRFLHEGKLSKPQFVKDIKRYRKAFSIHL